MSLDSLGKEPAHFADCCVAVSRPLIQAVAARLPRSPALVLSIGSGSGFLENLLLEYVTRSHYASPLDLYGVEVPSCANKHLPAECLLRVDSTTSLYTDAVFASALLFVYPRQVSLIAQYLNVCLGGALESLLWLGHRNDWPDAASLICAAFDHVEYYDGPGFVEYELLVIATGPKAANVRFARDG